MTKKTVSVEMEFVHGESYVDGIMFNNDEAMAVVIRKHDGSIGKKVVKRPSLIKKYNILDHFIIRGIIQFIEGSINQSRAEQHIIQLKKNKEGIIKRSASYLSVFAITVFGIMLYFILPTFVAFLLKNFIESMLLLNVIEALLRLLFFLSSFFVMCHTKSVKKSSLYHGAEHKAGLCYLNREKLTIENIKKYSIYNPSCGTSFMLILVLISIPFFMFLPYDNIILRVSIMLLLMPLFVGIAFDAVVWLGKNKSKIAKTVGMPGIYLQRLNTKEPTDEHLEVALICLKALLDF